jgi:hypothetical protein
MDWFDCQYQLFAMLAFAFQNYRLTAIDLWKGVGDFGCMLLT